MAFSVLALLCNYAPSRLPLWLCTPARHFVCVTVLHSCLCVAAPSPSRPFSESVLMKIGLTAVPLLISAAAVSCLPALVVHLCLVSAYFRRAEHPMCLCLLVCHLCRIGASINEHMVLLSLPTSCPVTSLCTLACRCRPCYAVPPCLPSSRLC